ncbi:hypothetical protein JNK62_03110 [bacterium]|nr:hypothetical protein [bacterium]
MIDYTKYITKAADHVHLTETERRDMSRIVREYMAHKPLPQEEYVSISSTSIRWFSFAWIKQPIAAALALVFIFGSGVSYAAEGALPGDALYSVKTKINESVKVALATDTEAKASVQMELAERRIEEAAALAAENRLDADTQQSLAVAFEAHAQSATAEVATIDESDASAAAEITSRFETRLAAHEEVLALVSEADATNTLTTAIRGAGLAVADIRARAEERIAVSLPAASIALAMDAAPAADTMAKAAPEAATMAMMAAPADEPAPEARTAKVANTDTATTGELEEKYDSRAANRMKASAEAQLKAAQKKLKSSKASKEIKAEAEAQLALSEDRIEEGRTFLKDKAHAQAYHAFQQSLVISEKLNVLLKSETAFKKAGTRAAEARTNARAKVNEAKEEPRSSTTNAKVQVNIEAATEPVQLEVETEAGATVHDVIPVIPPTLKIFKFDSDEEDRGLINIGL